MDVQLCLGERRIVLNSVEERRVGGLHVGDEPGNRAEGGRLDAGEGGDDENGEGGTHLGRVLLATWETRLGEWMVARL